jgi:hypothetical protein
VTCADSVKSEPTSDKTAPNFASQLLDVVAIVLFCAFFWVANQLGLIASGDSERRRAANLEEKARVFPHHAASQRNPNIWGTQP